MNQKRLAVISYHTCPLSDEKDAEIGGINTYVLELSKSLVKVGYLVDIFTRCVHKDSPKIVSPSSNLRIIHLDAGQKVKRDKKELIQYIPEFIYNLLGFMQRENFKYDLISAHYYMSGIIGLEIKKVKKMPMIMTFHTLGLMKNLVARNESEKADFFRIESEIALCRQSDRIIATSEADMEYINSLYDCPKEKICILTPGVDLNLFKPIDKKLAKDKIGAEPDHKLILFVGRIEALKGIDVLLYAIKILAQKNLLPKICLWIVGGSRKGDREEWPEELLRLEAIRKLLKISSFVKFVGKKSRLELPFYYNSCEVAIMPSLYESFGQTTLEAMACGVPVITTDVSGVSSFLDSDHNSLITSASNPIMLAQKIFNLLKDDKKREKMSQEVYEKVADLSWDKLAEKFDYFLTK